VRFKDCLANEIGTTEIGVAFCSGGMYIRSRETVGAS